MGPIAADEVSCIWQGMKVGVMRQTISTGTADASVMQLFETALQNLTQAGGMPADTCYSLTVCAASSESCASRSSALCH